MQKENFETILLPHEGQLRAFARTFTKDCDEAADLYQDTVIKAFQYFDKFTAGTNLKAWLFTIMHHTFINGYRKRERRATVLVRKLELLDSDHARSACENGATVNFFARDVQRMLALLPEIYLEPFQRHFEGYKYAEIALELDIPLGTVKTRIHSARELLKKYLRPYQR